VYVPENVDANGVHAQCLAHPDAVFPIWSGDARIVNFGRFYHKRLAIEQKCAFTDGEIAVF
jgi:hypothetical protein